MYDATLILTHATLPPGTQTLLDCAETESAALAKAYQYASELERDGYTVTVKVQKA